jgi:hypothetical protein
MGLGRLVRGIFPARSLDRIHGPTPVRVRGCIAPGPEVESPVTRRRAAVIGWFFSQRYTLRGAGTGGRAAHGRELDRDAYSLGLAGCFVPAGVVVEADGRRVRVETARLRCRIASSDWEGIIPDDPLPPPFDQFAIDTSNANLRYGERWLAAGDSVILRATVIPARGDSGPYRGTSDAVPPADLEATGAARIDDTIGRDLDVHAGRVSRH